MRVGAFGIVVGDRVVAVMLTRKAAERRLRREQETEPAAKLTELWWSSALKEDA